MAQPQSLAEPGEAPGLVAGAVIGQDSPEGDAERAVVAQEASSARQALCRSSG